MFAAVAALAAISILLEWIDNVIGIGKLGVYIHTQFSSVPTVNNSSKINLIAVD